MSVLKLHFNKVEKSVDDDEKYSEFVGFLKAVEDDSINCKALQGQIVYNYVKENSGYYNDCWDNYILTIEDEKGIIVGTSDISDKIVPKISLDFIEHIIDLKIVPDLLMTHKVFVLNMPYGGQILFDQLPLYPESCYKVLSIDDESVKGMKVGQIYQFSGIILNRNYLFNNLTKKVLA